MNETKVVIIGAGFAGLRVAKALAGARASVTLIDRSNHHLFQPLLYQVATAGLSPANIAAPIRGVLRGQKNADVLLGEVVAVDPSRKMLSLASGQTVPYDLLVIATGARHSYFGHDDWEEFAPGLKSISDATKIRRKILTAFELAEAEKDPKIQEALLSFVIVGGGPTGVELAGSIAELAHVALRKDFRHIHPEGARIVLIEAGERVLAAFPQQLSTRAARDLKRLGVEVRCGARVERVTAEGVEIGTEKVAARTVIWAAGVVASPAGQWLNIKTDRAGRVPVNSFLQLENHADIYVIGDTAWVNDSKGNPLPGVAPVAMQQGSYVGNQIKARLRNQLQGRQIDQSAFKPFVYVDKGNLATIGRKSAVADIRGFHLSGFFAWVTWLAVHIFYLIGFRNRVFVLIEWAWAYVTFQRGARLITP